jgi:hypothetical protein
MASFSVGDVVEVRDHGHCIEWKSARVSSVQPLEVKVDGWSWSTSWDEVRAKPADADDADKALPFCVADTVEVRDRGHCAEWKSARVTSTQPLEVKVDGWSWSTTWDEVRVKAAVVPEEVNNKLEENIEDEDWEFVESATKPPAEPVCTVPPAEPFQWTVDNGELPPTPELKQKPEPADEDAKIPTKAVEGDGSERPDRKLPREAVAGGRTASVESVASTSSVFRLAPPPPPSCSVGSPAVADKAVVIEKLVDEMPAAPAPTSPVAQAPQMEANLAAVAAALAVGPPARIQFGDESKLKEFKQGEQTSHASDDEATGLALAATAADAYVDDEACETLLGSAEESSRSRGANVPLGRMNRNDGLDSASDEDEAAPMNRTGQLPAAPKRPEVRQSPDISAQPEAPPSRGKGASASASPTVPRGPPKGASLIEVDAHIAKSLDRFFSDDRVWAKISAEMSKCPKLLQSLEWIQRVATPAKLYFKVMVPEPYPGIQYRGSKVLTDRYTRYAPHGQIVAGLLEDDSNGTPWLKVAENYFLPMRVGAVQILKPVQPEEAEISPPFSQGGDADARRGSADSKVGASDEAAAQAQSLLGAPKGEYGGVLRTDKLDQTSGAPGPLSHLDEAHRLLSHSDPINPFTDTPRGGSPNTTPLKSRLLSDPMVPINPFSDTPPGGNSPRATPLRTRPASKG